MFGAGEAIVGSVFVHTTDNRGFTPEELAQRAVDKIVYVGASSHPVIRDQAEVFKEQIRAVVEFYLKEAVKCHNTTIAYRLQQAGHPELATLLD